MNKNTRCLFITREGSGARPHGVRPPFHTWGAKDMKKKGLGSDDFCSQGNSHIPTWGRDRREEEEKERSLSPALAAGTMCPAPS